VEAAQSVTTDLGNGRSVTIDPFNGKVWIALRARGASIGNELTREQAMELGIALFRMGRGRAR
jgi:hypothetical protein